MLVQPFLSRPNYLRLLEKRKRELRLSVGLRQDGHTGLLQYLSTRQFSGLFGYQR